MAPLGLGARFGPGSTPSTDRSAYPSRDDLLQAFDDATTRGIGRLGGMTPAEFAAPLPDPNHRDRYPTLGRAAVHILCSHVALHIGQLSCWVRSVSSR